MNDTAFLAIFPFLFIGMWFAVTSAIGWWSGWYALQDRFPNREAMIRDRLHLQSAGLGKGRIWNPWGNVNYGSCLRFDICQEGLRVAVWRIFGPFCRPFLVPWDKITVEEVRFLFFPYYRLSFGDPDLSALTIRSRAYRRIVASGLLR